MESEGNQLFMAAFEHAQEVKAAEKASKMTAAGTDAPTAYTPTANPQDEIEIRSAWAAGVGGGEKEKGGGEMLVLPPHPCRLQSQHLQLQLRCSTVQLHSCAAHRQKREASSLILPSRLTTSFPRQSAIAWYWRQKSTASAVLTTRTSTEEICGSLRSTLPWLLPYGTGLSIAYVLMM